MNDLELKDIPPPPITTQFSRNVNYLKPWSDRVNIYKEDENIYLARNKIGMELLIIYSLGVSIIFLVVYIRFRKDNIFWMVFTISIIWALFGSLSIWYSTLHGDWINGVILGVLFWTLQIIYMIGVLEPRNQLYKQYSTINR